ncbi:MAG: IS110 family transposase [Armatimonadetes bacterium]|nr:IS110 family transposase [Armatimonadota bacterium]
MSNYSTPVRVIDPREYDVFIGMDVDKRSIALTHVDHLGVEKSVKMAHESSMVLNFVRNRFLDKRNVFVYEAGPTGFGLYDDLTVAGYDCLVVSPASVPTARSKRVKTNRLDSRQLALQLRGGSLESIHVPTEEYRMLRELVQLRKVHVKSISGNKCRIKSLFLRNGLDFVWPTPGGYWSKSVLSGIKNFECVPALRFKLGLLLEGLEFAQRHALRCQVSIREMVESSKELSDSVDYLRSLPGVGWIVASYAVARIGDWRLLGKSDELASFMGLVPTESSTGEGSNRGSITKAGDPTLRSLMIQAAWAAIREDPSLLEFYQRVYKGHSKDKAARIAIVAVARKLSARMHCVLKERRYYQVVAS